MDMGSPFPFGPEIPSAVIGEVGDIDKNDGVRVSIVGSDLVFKAAFDGNEVVFGMGIIDVLNAIAEFNHKHES